MAACAPNVSSFAGTRAICRAVPVSIARSAAVDHPWTDFTHPVLLEVGMGAGGAVRVRVAAVTITLAVGAGAVVFFTAGAGLRGTIEDDNANTERAEGIVVTVVVTRIRGAGAITVDFAEGSGNCIECWGWGWIKMGWEEFMGG